MKLKNYAIFLFIITLIEIAVLTINSKGVQLTKISISNLGSLNDNYIFYLVATSVLFIMFGSFLHKLYRSFGYLPRIEVYIIPVLAIIALLFKAPTVPNLAEVVHTILFVIIGIFILIVIYDLNKIIGRRIKTDKKILVTPKVAFYGTIAIFIIIGLNVITEIVYIGAILSWMHFIGVAAGSSI
jgi:hypothetical protein